MEREASKAKSTAAQSVHDALQRSADLIQAGKPAVAVLELKNVIHLAPSDWRLHNALGDALLAAGRDEEAIGAFMAAVRHESTLASAYVKIGRVYFSRGLSDQALFWLRGAMEVDSHCEGAMVSLAVAEARYGSRERVADLLAAWISTDPGDPIRRHLSTAILGEATPTKAADEYVTNLFDGYAQRFDESLEKLHYCGPQLIAEALDRFLPQAGDRNALDVGCGTGLVGEVLRPCSRHLVGVDLSRNMIQKAAERSLYDELHHDEMVSFMRLRPREFDLITAADVLTYCGDLSEFSASAGAALRDGGWLVILLEALEEDPAHSSYRLNRSGRYSHHEEYVKQCLLRSGFLVQAASLTSMRQDCGRSIPTLLVAAQRVSCD